MDKETLSNYGWIVILVLILSVLLALATPFGNFIAEGFKATYAGFSMVGDKALGIVIPGSNINDPDDGTPEGGTPGAGDPDDGGETPTEPEIKDPEIRDDLDNDDPTQELNIVLNVWDVDFDVPMTEFTATFIKDGYKIYTDTTDANGLLELKGVDFGEYDVELQWKGYTWYDTCNVNSEGYDNFIVLPPYIRAIISLREPDGTPYAGLVAEVTKNGTTITTATANSDGKLIFQFVPIGIYTVNINYEGDTWTETLTITETTFSMTFNGAPSIYDFNLRINDGTKDYGNYKIELYDNGSLIFSGTTNASGVIAMENIPMGVTLDMKVTYGGISFEDTFRLTNEGKVEGNFFPDVIKWKTPIYRSQCYCNDDHMIPLVGMTITVQNVNGQNKTFTTDSTGKAYLELIPVGTYSVTLKYETWTWSGTLTMKLSGSSLSFSWPSSFRPFPAPADGWNGYRISLVNSAGTAIHGVEVSIYNGSSLLCYSVTDSDGYAYLAHWEYNVTYTAKYTYNGYSWTGTFMVKNNGAVQGDFTVPDAAFN